MRYPKFFFFQWRQPLNKKNKKSGFFFVFFLRLRETHNTLELLVLFSFFSFFCQPYPGLRNCKTVFLILKIFQYGGSRQWVQLFHRYPCKNCCENWYLHFYMICDYQIWQAATSDISKLNLKLYRKNYIL